MSNLHPPPPHHPLLHPPGTQLQSSPSHPHPLTAVGGRLDCLNKFVMCIAYILKVNLWWLLTYFSHCYLHQPVKDFFLVDPLLEPRVHGGGLFQECHKITILCTIKTNNSFTYFNYCLCKSKSNRVNAVTKEQQRSAMQSMYNLYKGIGSVIHIEYEYGCISCLYGGQPAMYELGW